MSGVKRNILRPTQKWGQVRRHDTGVVREIRQAKQGPFGILDFNHSENWQCYLAELERVGSRHPIQMSHQVSPNDVQQCNPGNCWLLAAFAALAERPKTIEAIFSERHPHEEGTHEIQLFCFDDKK